MIYEGQMDLSPFRVVEVGPCIDCGKRTLTPMVGDMDRAGIVTLADGTEVGPCCHGCGQDRLERDLPLVRLVGE